MKVILTLAENAPGCPILIGLHELHRGIVAHGDETVEEALNLLFYSNDPFDSTPFFFISIIFAGQRLG